MNSMQAHGWLRAAQIFITIVLFLFLWRSIEWPDFFHLMTRAHWELVLMSVVLLLLCHLINVLRWKYLLWDNSPPFIKLLTFYGIGLFSNNFLPTGLGGDGVRAVLSSRYVSLTRAIFSVGLDRIVGLSALGFVFVFGLWLGLPAGLKIEKIAFLSQYRGVSLTAISVISLTGLLGLITILRVERLHLWVLHFLSRLIGSEGFPRWTKGHWLKMLSGAYGLSFAAQTGHVAAYWVILKALNIQVSLSASLWLVLVGSVIVLLPISINGLGLQESAYMVVLNNYGVESTMAIGFALTVRILMVMISLVGGLFLIGANLSNGKTKIRFQDSKIPGPPES